MMTATVYLDFGNAFPNGSLTVTESQMQHANINGVDFIDADNNPATAPVSLFGNGRPLISLTQSVQNQSIDLNGDGVSNQRDSDALANQVTGFVRRAFEPFQVDVVRANAANFSDVIDTLTDRSTNDAYIFVAGNVPVGTAFGWGQLDADNDRDNTAFAFADDVLQALPQAQWGSGLGRIAAHEAAHTFGLRHTSASTLLGAGDAMGAPVSGQPDLRNFGAAHLFSRFPLALQSGGGTQNNFDVLADPDRVGLKPNGMSYVTGTGGFDRISLTRIPQGPFISVQVQPFADPGMTLPLGAGTNYVIPNVFDVMVEAGDSGDMVVVDSSIGTSVHVRGGLALDRIVINGTAGDEHVTLLPNRVEFGSMVVTYTESEGVTVNTQNGRDTIVVNGAVSGIPLTINSGAGNDTIDLERTQALTNITVDGGANDDTIRLVPSARNLINLSGSTMMIDGGGGNDDRLFAWDENSNGASYDISATSLQRTFMGRVLYSDLDGLHVNTSTNDSSTVHVLGSRAGTPVFVNAGSDDDTFNIGNAWNTLDDIRSTVQLDGGAGTNDLAVNDHGSSLGSGYHVAEDGVFRGTGVEIRHADISDLMLNTSRDDDFIIVSGTPFNGSATVNAGDGDDHVSVGGGPNDLSRTARLTIDGQTGQDSLTLQDVAATQRTHSLTGSSWQVAEEPALHVEFADFNSIDLLAGAGSDTINLLATAGTTPIRVQAGDGWDDVHITVDSLSMLGAQRDLAIDGQQGYDRLFLHEPNSALTLASGAAFTVRDSNVQAFKAGTSLSVDYSDVDDIDIDAGNWNNSFDVQGTSSGLFLAMRGNDGHDVFEVSEVADEMSGMVVMGGNGADRLILSNVDPQTREYRVFEDDVLLGSIDNRRTVHYSSIEQLDLYGSSDHDQFLVHGTRVSTDVQVFGLAGNDYLLASYGDIFGEVTFDGGSQSVWDHLALSDRAASTGQSYALNSTSVTRPGQAAIHFADTEFVDLTATPHNDMIEVRGVASGSTTIINGALGDDTVSGDDTGATFELNGVDEGHLAGADFSSIENLAGGAGDDQFLMQPGGRLSGTVDGGGGTDTLDYSQRTDAVYANLETGAATSVANEAPGNTSQIENLTGGRNNDILVGDGSPNTLIGMHGWDLIIGRHGADVLEGRTQYDLLIGGYTSHDTDRPALDAIMAEWSYGGHSYARKIQQLRDPSISSRRNGDVALRRLQDQTVFADGAIDTLEGHAHLDWFWADPAGFAYDPSLPGYRWVQADRIVERDACEALRDEPHAICRLPSVNSPVGTTDDPTPTIRWSYVPNALYYDLWVDNVTTGESQVIRHETLWHYSYTPRQPLDAGTYRVRVRAINVDNQASDWSADHDFTISQTLGVPTVTGPRSSFDTTPTISWDAAAGASHYDLWVDNATSGQSQVIREQNVSGTSYTAASPLAAGNYRVWVRAVSSNGNLGSWSALHSFSINLPAPTAIGPAGVTADRTPTFSWSAVTNASRYELWVDNLTSSQSQVIYLDNLIGIDYTPTSSLNGGQYRFWVRAFNDDDFSSGWSSPQDFEIV